jgi:radical SAM protein with 4Fe4S-binding SPASM domain
MTQRRRLNVADTSWYPAYVVWELTLQCDHACHHCGSRASAARPEELGTEAALDVVKQLVAMGTTDIVLIGGEAYLHGGFLTIVEALAKAGVRVGLTTGGRGVTRELARAMKDHGLHQASVSVDGLEETHDRMRNLKGSFAGTQAALANLREVGIVTMANTNLNRSNHRDLEPLFEVLAPQIRTWQIQITTPLGRAADRTDMLLQPFDLLDVVPRVAELKRRARDRGVLIMPGNNLGYFGPEEALLRSQRADQRDHFSGCQAGRYVMGIESDGAVKGCPSLQTSHYVGGSLKDRTLQSIWSETPELAFTRARTREDLWGFCQTCPFGDVCLGGCSFTAHAVLGRPGNNPYCHFRARDFQKRGLRERLVPGEAAPGLPFDNGLFEIVVEPSDAPDPGANLPSEALVQISRRPTRMAPRAAARAITTDESLPEETP